MAEPAIPEEIWTIRYRRYGGPDQCGLEYVKTPRPGRGEVLVGTEAVSVNPVDWRLARGEFRIATGLRPNRVPGCDFAGIALACGEGVKRVKPGDRVFGMISALSGGTYAQCISVPESLAIPIPDELDMYGAASLPLTSLTAFQSLFVHGRIAPGAHVLVNGASGGVGVCAVQLARIGRARVVAVAGPKNRELCLELGASSYIDYTESFALTRGVHEYDLILDAADTLDPGDAFDALTPSGALIALNPRPSRLFASLVNRTKRRRHHVEIVRPDGPQLARIAEHVSAGRMRPVVADVLPITDFAEAWRRSMNGHVAGKLVLDATTGF